MRLFIPPLLLLCACSSYQPLALPEGMSALEGVVEEVEATAWIGIEVAPNESDSLEELEVWPGLRIVDVASGSPADRAGLRIGDVVLAVDDVEVDDPSRLENILHSYRKPSILLKMERGTRVFEVEPSVELHSELGKQRTLYQVDRVLLRAAFRDTKENEFFPEVAWLSPDSPLVDEGIQVGAEVVSFMGHDPGSAEELIRRLRLLLKPGDTAEMSFRHKGVVREIEVVTWSPPLVLIGFSLWPIWSWERNLEKDTEDLMIGDLILASIFKRSKMGGETRYTLFSVFSWKTGVALLESSN
ncbi:MAG: PDZ domain-containing protein [Planctomycetota bacterium]|nr:PDZ domain-containing protein [Planctomycetota bacterium]